MAIQKKTTKIGKLYKKTTVTLTDPDHYAKGMASTVYEGKNKPIKKVKVSVTKTPFKTKIKTTKYSPVSYYGKQKKTSQKRTFSK